MARSTLGLLSTLRQDQIGIYLQDQIRYAKRVSFVLGARRDRARSQVMGAQQRGNPSSSGGTSWSRYNQETDLILEIAPDGRVIVPSGPWQRRLGLVERASRGHRERRGADDLCTARSELAHQGREVAQARFFALARRRLPSSLMPRVDACW